MGESTCLSRGEPVRLETAVWLLWFAMTLHSYFCVCFGPDNRPTRAGAALRAAPSECGWAKK